MRNEIFNNEILFMNDVSVGEVKERDLKRFGMLIFENSEDDCHR